MSGDALAEPLHAFCDHKNDNSLPQMTVFEIVIPILMHLVTLSLLNMYCFAPTASVLNIVKPDVSQSKATFHKDVGFATQDTVADF